ncbi:hypothetical protein C2E23DRAFT_862969 [Lenzites betulinus]|nr:hypothetical protein C2E23DRAFT_862969 [Lenzites betulinus]
MLAQPDPLPSPGPPLQNGPVESAPQSESSETPSVDASASVNPDSTSSKKTYLSLLSTAQIIEICLLFEPHVPLHVKTAVWPADLETAILELKKTSQPAPPASPLPSEETTSTQQIQSTSVLSDGGHVPNADAPAPVQISAPPIPPAPVDPDPPMGSLKDPAEEAREKEGASQPASGATTTSAASPVPQPAASAQPQPHAGPSTPVPHAATPQPHAQHASLHPPAPYPYYGYALPQPQNPQSAYPHAPYYAPPTAYSSHYSYPPYGPPPGYPAPAPAHSPTPSHPHGQPSLFSTSPLVRPPIHPAIPAAQPPPPPPPEDLPSYEEMIVEALLDCGEAEGAAPKDLFTWMAARYPLQTNFRPSASQALQKAYKRGRLEKRSGGKYRLNPAWEGGATSKRTTRRPQTLAQTTYAMHRAPSQPTTSPFTHAPLQPHSHSPAPSVQQPYNGYPYSYPYGHYPGYPPHHPTAQPTQAKAAAPQPPAASARGSNGSASTAAKPTEDKVESGEGNDAWEAAQHILQAINFELAASSSKDSSSGTTAQAGAAADGASSHDIADSDLAAVLNALVSAASAAAPAQEPPRATLTEDERASLQAQLALLAAQLTEIAEGEDEDPEPETPVAPPAAAQTIHAPQPIQPSQAPPPAASPAHPQSTPPTESTPAAEPVPPTPAAGPPPPIAAFLGGSHIVLDINAFPEVFSSANLANLGSSGTPAAAASAEAAAPTSGHQTEGEELADEESDEDDDMEDVVVPLHPHPPPAHTHAEQSAVRT